MAEKRRGLGRGLDALLGGAALEPAPERLKAVSIERFKPSRFQPRKGLDPVRLQELADSISAQGIVQPVVARESGDGGYEIIAGERRWRAAQLAGLSELPVIVREVTDQAALAIALIENIQREDLNPLEEAEALRRLIDEYGMTHQQLADAVGKSRATITNLLRLNDLHPDAKQLLLSGTIEMGHARALLTLDPERQVAVARQAATEKLSVRATELLVQKLRENCQPQKRRNKDKDPDIRRLEQDISDWIGAPVVIHYNKQGAGQMVIRYDSLEQLEGVLERLRREALR